MTGQSTGSPETATANALATWWAGHVDEYLRLRRSLGYQLAWDEHLLHGFTVELARRNVTVVRVADAITWASALPPRTAESERPVSRARCG